MEHYVTLFDSFFLPQALALHRSMCRHAGPFTLWILCVDRTTHDVLTTLGLPHVNLISLEALEDERLLGIKGSRTRAEYCWTLTPQAPGFVFDLDPAVQRVTYIDADLWFMRSPEPIFREFDASGKSVLITEHAYAPEYDQSALTGRFCVQFVTFCRSAGEPVRQWWAERCMEWCFARFDDGKFGDQKYLDDWPERFASNVHVLSRTELILAPWNATRFPYSSGSIYHFHNLRLVGKGRVMMARAYDIPRATRVGVYGPYLQDLSAAVTVLGNAGHTVVAQARKPGLLVQGGILLRKWLRASSRLRPLMMGRLSDEG